MPEDVHCSKTLPPSQKESPAVSCSWLFSIYYYHFKPLPYHHFQFLHTTNNTTISILFLFLSNRICSLFVLILLFCSSFFDQWADFPTVDGKFCYDGCDQPVFTYFPYHRDHHHQLLPPQVLNKPIFQIIIRTEKVKVFIDLKSKKSVSGYMKS
ncbi:hypothetical protein L1887_11208 [Cichorium endivia]|nr:hypothetical protein L1887_11208 [Cichorium endivia]